MPGYKTALTAAMDGLAADPLVRFIGYGVRYGGKAAGTLCNVREEQLVETPVAENLMVGLAIGMSLRGLRPVVFIERFDFILNAMDAIVNHLDKLETISRGEFHAGILFRVVKGNRNKPLYTGATHTQDFIKAMREMVSFPVEILYNSGCVEHWYGQANDRLKNGLSTMLIEEKDIY